MLLVNNHYAIHQRTCQIVPQRTLCRKTCREWRRNRDTKPHLNCQNELMFKHVRPRLELGIALSQVPTEWLLIVLRWTLSLTEVDSMHAPGKGLAAHQMLTAKKHWKGMFDGNWACTTALKLNSSAGRTQHCDGRMGTTYKSFYYRFYRYQTEIQNLSIWHTHTHTHTHFPVVQ